MKQSGEILKEIRKFYKIRQEDAAGENMDRSLISHIESGKAPLLESIAIEITANINNVLKKRNINRKIDYLEFYPEKYGLYLIAKEHLKNLEKYLTENDIEKFDSEFKIIDDLLHNFNMPEIKLRLLESAGVMAEKQSEYDKAYYFLTRAIDNALITDDKPYQLKLYLKLCKVLYILEKYDDIIYVCNLLISKYDIEYQKEIVFYYLGASHHKLNNYSEAINYYNKIIPMCENSLNKLIDIKLNIAMCLKNIGECKESLCLLNEVIDLIKSPNSFQLALAYNVIINNYILLDNKQMIKKYSDTLIILIDNTEEYLYIPQILLELAEAELYLENNSLAETYFIKAFKLAKTKNMYDIQNKSIKHLLGICKKSNITNFEIIICDILDLSKKSKLNRENLTTVFEIIIDLIKGKRVHKLETILNYIKLNI